MHLWTEPSNSLGYLVGPHQCLQPHWQKTSMLSPTQNLCCIEGGGAGHLYYLKLPGEPEVQPEPRIPGSCTPYQANVFKSLKRRNRTRNILPETDALFFPCCPYCLRASGRLSGLQPLVGRKAAPPLPTPAWDDRVSAICSENSRLPTKKIVLKRLCLGQVLLWPPPVSGLAGTHR